MKNAVFYHAGCSVCVQAEETVARSIDPALFEIEFVHLGEERSRIDEAEGAGVKSVPALVIDGHPFHINFGASLEDLRS